MQSPRVGDRVSVTYWGAVRTGIVKRFDSSIVWVLLDNSPTRGNHWFHPESLTVTATKLDASSYCPECGRDYWDKDKAGSFCYINHSAETE